MGPTSSSSPMQIWSIMTKDLIFACVNWALALELLVLGQLWIVALRQKLYKIDREQNHCLSINYTVYLTHIEKKIGRRNEMVHFQIHIRTVAISAPALCGALTWVNGKKWFCPSTSLSVWLVTNELMYCGSVITDRAPHTKPAPGVWLNVSICHQLFLFLWLRFCFSMNSGKFDKQPSVISQM